MAELSPISQALYEQLSASSSEYFTWASIRAEFEQFQPSELRDALTQLVKTRALALSREDGEQRFSLTSTGPVLLSNQEELILRFLAEAGNEGLYINQLRAKSGVGGGKLSRALDRLCKQKLVKRVQTIQSRNRKLYMLFELTPSGIHTGGPWYTEKREFDSHLVDSLRKLLHQSAKRRALTITELRRTVQQSEITTATLDETHIAALADSMEAEGLFIAKDNPHGTLGDTSRVYLHSTECLNVHAPWKLPCTLCPFRFACAPSGTINPGDCRYLALWCNPETEEAPTMEAVDDF